MIEVHKENIGGSSVLRIGYFDLSCHADDRIFLKEIISRLFSIGDEVYFFFRREESLTEVAQLAILKRRIFEYFSADGEFRYLRKLDDQRFDAIAKITYDFNTPNLILDFWQYFYACSFFRPINDLTFDEYEDYLIMNGVNDIDGLKQLENLLSDFKAIKGIGGDQLTISYRHFLKLEEHFYLDKL